jgi:hypothetical protein
VFFPRVALDTRSAQPALVLLAKRVAPHIAWGKIEPVGTHALRMASANALAALTWVAHPSGTAGTFYSSAAEARSSGETLARIFESFKVVGPETVQPLTRKFVQYLEPRERAFSIQIPQGWQATGGLVRLHAVDVRSDLRVSSPDGRVIMAFGDPQIPPFVEPNQTLDWTGFREGSAYSPGYGVTFMVRRFRDGLTFAREYVTGPVAQQCSAVQITNGRLRPDLVDAINKVYATNGTGVSFHMGAGEVEFACTRNGEATGGYVFALTQRTAAAGTATWNVEKLYGVLAPRGQADAARALLAHMVASVQINPEWFQRQQGTTGAISRIVTQTNEVVSHGINDSWRKQQASQDELSRRRSNATLGLEDTVDTATGQRYKVESGSNYYWVDLRGNIVGTDVHTRPNLDFRELTRMP